VQRAGSGVRASGQGSHAIKRTPDPTDAVCWDPGREMWVEAGGASMDAVTRGDSTLGRALGVLLFVVALLLSIPGVRAVRAGEPDMTPIGIADLRDREPVAPAAPGPEACGDPSAAAESERQRAQLAVQLPPTTAGEGEGEASTGFILLNNRGYNYGPPPEADPAR